MDPAIEDSVSFVTIAALLLWDCYLVKSRQNKASVA
jgi:hypothetical protein